MSTTALFIDLLITGIQVAIWLVLLIFSLFGFEWVKPDHLKGYETALAILLLPIVYPIGVFIDNLADDILSGWKKKIRKKLCRR